MKIVISLGGSLLTKELTVENFGKYVDAVKKLRELGHKVIVVCGGGKVCREYQNIARSFDANKDKLDFIGIMASHINASTFYTCLGDLGYLIRWKSLKDIEKEVVENFENKIIVAGGYDVGVSTDYDASYLAKIVKADMLINATNVSGVYDKDPNKYSDAKKIPKMSYQEFIDIIKNNVQSPGEYRLFDLKAAELIKDANIRTLIIDGNNPDEIIKAVEGKHSGTEVL